MGMSASILAHLAMKCIFTRYSEAKAYSMSKPCHHIAAVAVFTHNHPSIYPLTLESFHK